MILDTVIMALDISEENLSQLTKTNSRVGALQEELRAAKAAMASSCTELKSTSNRLAFLVPCYSETNLDQLEEALDGRSNKEWLVSVGLYFLLPVACACFITVSRYFDSTCTVWRNMYLNFHSEWRSAFVTFFPCPGKLRAVHRWWWCQRCSCTRLLKNNFGKFGKINVLERFPDANCITAVPQHKDNNAKYVMHAFYAKKMFLFRI